MHQEDLDTLREMFPDASITELVHCLVLSDGDLESAALWVLHRQEMEESLAQSSRVCSLSQLYVIHLSSAQQASLKINKLNFSPELCHHVLISS